MTNYSNEIDKKKTMHKLLSCLFPKTDDDKKSERINKDINARLKRDEKIYKATYRLLLLGSNECHSCYQTFLKKNNSFLS